jgi:drug/metabolite transporter (DMT)-like permease
VIRWGSVSPGFITGFICIQACNLCFAFGQVAYKRWRPSDSKDGALPTFGFFFLGAWIVSSGVLLLWGKPNYPTTLFQWGVLLWLGTVASGVGYFLWNNGARRVNAGALAIMNNALIPAGLLVNVVFWGQAVDPVRLGAGTGIMLLSLWINEHYRPRRPKTTTGP